MTITEFLLARVAEDEEAALDGFSPWALAECEAKRRIVEAHPASRPSPPAAYNPREPACGTCVTQVGNGLRFPRVEIHLPHPCPTLLALASAYANHPDYRQEWA